MSLDQFRDGPGDSYNRRKVGPDELQCGCRWERRPLIGDVLIECPLHKAATAARHACLERHGRLL